jgi:predicted nucleotidyltransferase
MQTPQERNLKEHSNMDDLYRDIYLSMANIFGESMEQVVLYGSYARGDYDDESDVDIAIIAKGTDTELHRYHHAMVKEAGRFMREYDKLVSFHEIPLDRYERFKEDYPYYRNIEMEGIRLYA